MAVSVKGSGRVMLSEINVTPMVDVMLVLLIIFMVTAPLIQEGVEVALPRTKAQVIETSEAKLVLSIDKQRRIFIGKTEIKYPDLAEKLMANAKLRKDREIYLQADRTLPYGFIVEVMAILRSAGVEQLGMITEVPEEESKG